MSIALERNMVEIETKKKLTLRNKVKRPKFILTTFDRLHLNSYYFQKVLLYKGENFDEMVKNLENGLLEALDYFWPLAGKMKKYNGVYSVECNGDDNVVETWKAYALDLEVDQLVKDETTVLSTELMPLRGVHNSQGIHHPLMVFQFTRLKDGIAIGSAINHSIVDGRSAMHFMSYWAEICKHSRPLSPLPSYERTQVRTRCSLAKLPRLMAFTVLFFTPKQRSPQKLRNKIFRFSETKVDKIKNKANSNLCDGFKPISSFQSLSAHIWRAITRARRTQIFTVCIVIVDCRRRIEPPLPETYFGNLVQSIQTITLSSKLTRSRNHGERLLQNMINSHDSKEIKRNAKFLGSLPNMQRFMESCGNCVLIGSSPRFRCYDLDFGWGKPETMIYGPNNKFDGMVFLSPGREGGRSVDVDICLKAKTMEILEKDDDFLMGFI